MVENKLKLTFEGPLVNDHGVPFDDLMRTVSHVQRAIRLLIREYEGIDENLGRPPRIVAEQSALRLVAITNGSVTTEWELAPPIGVQPHLNRSGVKAVRALIQQGGAQDEALSETVRAELNEIGNGLSDDVDVVKLTSPNSNSRVEFRRPSKNEVDRREPDTNLKARLRGRLLEVNWDRGTAQLHRYADKYIRLEFDDGLSDEMLRLATRHVEVRGRGVINDKDVWSKVEVEQIDETSSWAEAFDLQSVLDEPNPKVFRRDEIVGATDGFDVAEFNRIVRDGRRDS